MKPYSKRMLIFLRIVYTLPLSFPLIYFTLCLTLSHLESATLDCAKPAAYILLGCWVMRPAIYVLAYLAAWAAELIKKEPDPDIRTCRLVLMHLIGIPLYYLAYKLTLWLIDFPLAICYFRIFEMMDDDRGPFLAFLETAYRILHFDFI